jgi:ribosomal protein S27AE
MNCKFCQHELPEASNFCGFCGRHQVSGEMWTAPKAYAVPSPYITPKVYRDGKLCLQCGTAAIGKRAMKGSFLIELVLWLCLFVPGLIYSLWRLSTKYYVCPKCGSDQRVPFDSPLAQRTLSQLRA